MSNEFVSGFVAIIGRPNAGKSTLLNAILGTNISIVTPKAQTTREKTLGILTEKEGQIVFIDTPGIHKAREGGINAFMVNEAKQALDAPSAIWYLIDPRSALAHEQEVLTLLKGNPAPVILLMNKADDRENGALAEEVEQALKAQGGNVLGVYAISAKAKRGVAELLQLTWSQMVKGPMYYPDEDQLSDRPTRYFVGEKVREQLYLKLGEELPYSCAVEIEKYDEKAKPPRIEAVIYVERDSQKGIVVGKGGAKIKEIGMAARTEIEAFLGEKIFLGLKVKLLKDWTRDSQALKRMGYTLPTPKKGSKGPPKGSKS